MRNNIHSTSFAKETQGWYSGDRVVQWYFPVWWLYLAGMWWLSRKTSDWEILGSNHRANENFQDTVTALFLNKALWLGNTSRSTYNIQSECFISVRAVTVCWKYWSWDENALVQSFGWGVQILKPASYLTTLPRNKALLLNVSSYVTSFTQSGVMLWGGYLSPM